MEKVGTIEICYSKVGFSKFPQRIIKKEDRSHSREVWYKLPMVCEVGLAEEVGVLQFSVTCDGKSVGTAKLVFESN